MVFAEDGCRAQSHQPYSANSGFFFVRNNEYTRYFFSTLVRMGDSILDVDDQHVVNTMIREFASSKGLRSKVIPLGSSNPFPGGVEFHHRPAWDIFRQMFNHDIYPYTLHMSWTVNMTYKVQYFQQLGMWFLGNDTSTCSGLDCCLEEANFICHYQDKPSKYPCPHAPNKDEYGRPFWE